MYNKTNNIIQKKIWIDRLNCVSEYEEELYIYKLNLNNNSYYINYDTVEYIYYLINLIFGVNIYDQEGASTVIDPNDFYPVQDFDKTEIELPPSDMFISNILSIKLNISKFQLDIFTVTISIETNDYINNTMNINSVELSQDECELLLNDIYLLNNWY